MTGYRTLTEANRRDVMRDINFYVRSSSDPRDTYRQALDAVQTYAAAANEELERSATGLRSVTRSLAGLPGRKALLYVADGLSELPGQDLYEHLIQSYTRGTAVGGSNIDRPIDILDSYRPEIFQEIVADANANQVTVYTLNAQGHFGDGTLSAEMETVGARGGGNSEIESIRNANLQAPMIHLAERTGGTAIRNTINFDGALEKMGQDFDVFYSLGYRSPRGGDSKFHSIEVKVRRPGLEVRHRSGYVDKPQVERVADRTLSSLLLDLEKNPLGVGVDFGPPEKQGRKKYVLPVIVRIPLKELALLPQGDVGQGKVTIFLGVRDEEGGISDIHRLPLPLTLPKERLASRSGEIDYRTNLEISKGTPTVAVAVWDELSGTESFVHKKVQLGPDRRGRRGR
jgi:VWFA-related protein